MSENSSRPASVFSSSRPASVFSNSRPASVFGGSTGSNSVENTYIVSPFSMSQNAAAPLSDLTQYINPDVKNTRVQNAIGNHIQGYQKKSSRPDTYKTVMCQAWLESTMCSFGENCKFAHGEQELRPVRFQQRNNHKYKTKMCDKYTTTGICPYGSRCLFIHPQPTNVTTTAISNYISPNWTPPVPAAVEFEYSKLQLMAMSRCGPPSAAITAHYQGQVDGSAPLDSSFQFNEAAESMVKFLWA
ncbi:hypothetical protein M3Y98_00574500 [Aphelenchoides besseyi]|nr:hypothetical protein M3Y98_00574500 [Aphelenchoides besseyi]KAI6193822.1 hypothetical protein M3Y96_01059600 [Aphelenchoides besseyi]